MRKRASRLALVLLLACSLSAESLATTWAPHEVTCPVCRTKNTFMQVVSFGSYIYQWPSKFQYIFWPLTDSPVLYSCRKCRHTAFMWDFEQVPKEKLAALAKAVEGVAFGGGPYAKYTDIPMSERLAAAEKVYGVLGDRDDEWWCRFERVRGYHFAAEKKEQEAAAARRRALALAEKMLGEKGYAGRRKELLLITGAMKFFLDDAPGALADFDRALKLKYADAGLKPEQAENVERYLTELLNDYVAAIKDAEKAKTEPVWPHRVLEGHEGWVGSLAFAPDGRTLISADYDQAVIVWDVESGKARRKLTGRGTILTVACSPDGTKFAGGGYGAAVDLRDARTGELVHTFGGHEGHVSALAFAPGGKLLASGSWDDTVKLWDLENMKLLRTLRLGESVWDLAFAPDGRTIAVADFEGAVKLWDVRTGSLRRTLARHKGANFVAYSPDGRVLATEGAGDEVFLWDPESGALLRKLVAKGHRLSAVAFSPDGARLASAGWDGTVRLWEVATGKLLETLTERGGHIRAVAFSPDGATLATGHDDNSVNLWDVRPGVKRRAPLPPK